MCQGLINPVQLIGLDLSINCIVHFYQEQLTCLRKQKNLYQMKNEIPIVKDSPFKSLPSLRLLDLKNNKITPIVSCAFCGLKQIPYINLVGNEIFDLGKTSFFTYLS